MSRPCLSGPIEISGFVLAVVSGYRLNKRKEDKHKLWDSSERYQQSAASSLSCR